MQVNLKIEAALTAEAHIIQKVEPTEEGLSQFQWTVYNFKKVVEKLEVNQKLSSEEFEEDGVWYLDLYPRGYYTPDQKKLLPPGKKLASDAYISLYLHSGRSQVEKGDVKNQFFNLGILRQGKGRVGEKHMIASVRMMARETNLCQRCRGCSIRR